MEEGAAALSFSASSGFVGDVAPELLKHRVNCRSFLHTKENQASFDILRRDLAKAFQVHYGVRMDMLMDNLFDLGREVRIKAIADLDPERVRALMTKDVSEKVRYDLELDKIDAKLRTCKMDPDTITFYTDAEEMLDREALDGVMIGTKCNTHAAFAKLVLERGIPLFLEKPVGVCQEDLELLKECAKTTKSPVVVSFPLRVTNIVQEAKRIIDA